jgi:hypothetical protein
MSRLVVRVLGGHEPGGQTALAIQLEDPPLLGRRPVPFACTGEEPEFTAVLDGPLSGDAVRTAGVKLYEALAANPDLKPYLDSAMQVQSPGRYPVFVELATTGAEALPWEALCSPNGEFLGLDERWAVGRIVDTLNPLEPVWRFAPPLKVAAVLSALGVPARDELEALQAACTAAALPVELLVLVSEVALESSVSAGAPPWMTVEFVPPDVEELQRRVQRFKPHVLHLFCHGSAAGSSPHLEIAIKADWVGAATASSLLVEAREVRDFTSRTDSLPWLVVLNCCESATDAGMRGAQSVAMDLIYEGGVPAVVGMREPVRSDDATLFTEAFYGQLFPELCQRIVGTGGDGGAVDWARLVVAARTRLVKKHLKLLSAAGSGKEWTLPVVYTRPGSFAVQTSTAPTSADPQASAGTARRLRLRLEALTGFRAQVAATGDPALLADLDSELADLIAHLASLTEHAGAP